MSSRLGGLFMRENEESLKKNGFVQYYLNLTNEGVQLVSSESSPWCFYYRSISLPLLFVLTISVP